MDYNKYTIPELKKIVLEHKKEHCPNVSKLKKKELVDFVSKMGISAPEKGKKTEKKTKKKTEKKKEDDIIYDSEEDPVNLKKSINTKGNLNKEEEKQWKFFFTEIKDVKTFDDEKLKLSSKELDVLENLFNRVSDNRKAKLIKELKGYVDMGRGDEVKKIIKRLSW